MSIVKGNETRLKSFFSDRKGSERTSTLNTLKEVVECKKDNTVNFVMLWGASDKSHATKTDIESLLYLFHFLKNVEDIFDVKTKLTLIFTDTHAYLNGYHEANFIKYITDIGYHLKKHNFSYVFSSLLCKDKINLAGFKNYPDFIDSIILNSVKLFNSLHLDRMNLIAIDNFYKYALRHCKRIGYHESGLYFKDEEVAAKAYLYFAFFEKEVITNKFIGNAFITYMSREEEFALPDLPIIRLYSIKSGLRTRPWFVYNY